jgi:hypothetical protein
MQKKVLSFAVIEVGIIILLLSLFADMIGIGYPGFGYNQIIGTVIGVIIGSIGFVLYQKCRSKLVWISTTGQCKTREPKASVLMDSASKPILGWHWGLGVPFCMASLFGLANIVQSLHQGQLSVPITFDDIIYFLDGLKRLQSIYDFGVRQFLVDYFHNPPHSPLATIEPLVAFALLGSHEWAPAVVNIFYVASVLILVRIAMKGHSLVVYLGVAVPLLSWPLMGHLIVVSHPDIVCGLLIAFGIVQITSRPWLSSGTRNLLLISACFGLALLAKPTISPITVGLYLAGLSAATLIDLPTLEPPPSIRAALAFNARSMLIVAVMALPHYLLAWRHVYEYIYVSTFGREKDIWALKMNAVEHLSYYLTGIGGRFMMGDWLFLTLASVLISLWLSRAYGRHVEALRVVGVMTLAAFACLAVSIPEHKSPYVGALVPSLVMVGFAKTMIFNLDTLSRAKHRGWLGAYIFIAICAALLLHSWPWKYRSGAPEVEPQSTSLKREALLSDLTHLIAERHPAGGKVFFVGLTPYLNAPILNFALLQHRVRGIEGFDLHLSSDMSAQVAALESSDVAITFTNGNDEVATWLPSAQVIPAVNAIVAQNPAFTRLAVFASPSGQGNVELYVKPMAFEHIRADDGLGPLEGPYPQWKLPRVRWGLGPSMSFTVNMPADRNGVLRLTAQSPWPGQTMSIIVARREVKRCGFTKVDAVETFDVPLAALAADSKVTVQFLRWQEPTSSDPRKLAVLFHDIAIVHPPK